MPAYAPVEEASANSEAHAGDVGHPVCNIRAAVESWLNQLNQPTEGTCANEDGRQAEATGMSQWESEGRKAKKVHQLVYSILRRRWSLERPKHCDGECQRHNQGK